MGVKIKLNISQARERATFINGTKYFHQQNAQLEQTHSKIFQGSLNRLSTWQMNFSLSNGLVSLGKDGVLSYSYDRPKLYKKAYS